VFLIHRRNIIEPIEVGQRLEVGFVLDQLFSAAVEQADVGVDTLDYLTVQFQYKAQHAMSRRVLWSKIDREIAQRSFGHARLVLSTVSPGERPDAFTSSAGAPTRDIFAPDSQEPFASLRFGPQVQETVSADLDLLAGR
jgi:hypothetical protein